MTKTRVYLVDDTVDPIVETGTVQNGSIDPKNKAFFARIKGRSMLAHWDDFTDEIRCAGFTDELKAEEFCRKLKNKTTAASEKK